MKKFISKFMEYFRFVGIALLFYLTYSEINDNIARFHIISFGSVILMSGTVAIEGLFLGEDSAKKIGYSSDRQYQVQSALANLAIALGAIVVFFAKWGKFADGTIVTVMFFFSCSPVSTTHYRL